MGIISSIQDKAECTRARKSGYKIIETQPQQKPFPTRLAVCSIPLNRSLKTQSKSR